MFLSWVRWGCAGQGHVSKSFKATQQRRGAGYTRLSTSVGDGVSQSCPSVVPGIEVTTKENQRKVEVTCSQPAAHHPPVHLVLSQYIVAEAAATLAVISVGKASGDAEGRVPDHPRIEEMKV